MQETNRLRKIIYIILIILPMKILIFGLCEDACARLSITIVYDNNGYREGLMPDWGFSCLIKGTEKTILFDTGKEGGILLENFGKLNENPKQIDCVVISHNHPDHIGGLLPFLAVNNNVTVYLPNPTIAITQRILAQKAKYLKTDQPTRVCKGVFLSGAMGEGIKEQSLIVNTPMGLILIVGCSHPGILNVMKKVQELFRRPLYLVIGGFHTMPESEEGMRNVIRQFKTLGVRKVGPAHCTDIRAKERFKTAYGKDYIQMGVGKVLRFSARKKPKY